MSKARAFRCLISNPLTGRRISITRRSREERDEMRLRIKRIFRDVKDGYLTAKQAQARLEVALYGPLTLSALWTRYTADLPDSRATRMRSVWRKSLAAFAHKHPSELTESVVSAWYARELGRTRATSAYQTYTVLHACLARAVRAGSLPEIPWYPWHPRRPKSAPRPAAVSANEVRRLAAAAASISPELGRRVVLLALCGLRQGEAAALGWDDVDLHAERPALRVRHQTTRGWTGPRPTEPTKSRSERRVPLSPDAVRTLVDQRQTLEARGVFRNDGPVFPTPKGAWRRLPRIVESAELRRIAMAAGLSEPLRWVPHSLRHTYATIESQAMAQSGAGTLRDLMARTGHGDARVLEGYLHAGEERAFLGSVLAPETLPENVVRLEAPGRLDLAEPSADEDAAGRHYARAYGRTLRATGDKAAAQKAGRRAKAAFLAQRARRSG